MSGFGTTNACAAHSLLEGRIHPRAMYLSMISFSAASRRPNVRKGFRASGRPDSLRSTLATPKGPRTAGLHRVPTLVNGVRHERNAVCVPQMDRIRMLACARNDTADVCQCFLIRELPINSQVVPWRRSQLRRLSGCVPCGIEQYCAQ